MASQELAGVQGQKRPVHCRGDLGAQIIDELAPLEGEHLVEKTGFNGFSNRPLDAILRNQDVNTRVMAGVTTCVCVSSTIRGGVEHNYRMIVVGDATADGIRDTHDSELKVLGRAFGDITTTDDVIGMLGDVRSS